MNVVPVCSVLVSFLPWLLCGLAPCRAHGADGVEVERAVVAAAFQTGSETLRSAADSLVRAGVLRNVRLPSDSEVWGGDCTVIVRDSLLHGSVVATLATTGIPERIRELDVRFEPRGIRVTGSVDGPLFVDPKFDFLIGLDVPETNVIDMYVRQVRIGNLELRRFAGLVQWVVQRGFGRRFAAYASTRSMGRAVDGSSVIRITVDPVGFTPMAGQGAGLTGIHGGDGWIGFSVAAPGSVAAARVRRMADGTP